MRAFAIAATLLMLFVVADSNIVKAASADPALSPQSADGGNGTAPPPVAIPSRPTDEAQRPVGPGTVTQGWSDADIVSGIGERGTVRLVESDSQLRYETPYGNFFLQKGAPYFVGVGRPGAAILEGKVADSAFLVIFNNTLLTPAYGKIDSGSQSLLVFHYAQTAGGRVAGTLTLTYNFSTDRDKISASFVPSIGTPADFRIAWLTFTYVGRTQHPVARAWQHRHSLDPLKRPLVFEKQAVGLTKAQARGLEQILFEQHGGFKSLLSQILPLNPNHRLAEFYLEAGREIWRTL